jgi:hypothetical protein
MKQKTIFIGIVILTVIILSNCAKQDDFPVLKGPYLGLNILDGVCRIDKELIKDPIVLC